MVSDDKRTKGFYSTVPEPTGVLSGLVPYSKYKMFMVVANNHFESPPSNVVEFTTKEGGEDRDSVLDSRSAPQGPLESFVHPHYLHPDGGNCNYGWWWDTRTHQQSGAGFKLPTLYTLEPF